MSKLSGKLKKIQKGAKQVITPPEELSSQVSSEPELIAAFRRKYAATLLILVAMVLGVVMIIILASTYSKEHQVIQDSMKLAFRNPAYSGGISILGDDSKLPRSTTYESKANNTIKKIVPVYVVRANDVGIVTLVESGSNIIMRPDILSDSIKEAINSSTYTGYIKKYKIFYSLEETPTGYQIAFADGQGLYKDMLNLVKLCLIGFFVIMFAFVFIASWISRLAVHPIKEAWTTQKRFIADASHELKTPLSVILANTDIILKHPNELVLDNKKWLESTKSEAKSMQNLVQDLLTLSKLQSQPKQEGSQIQASMKMVNFSELVQKASLQFEVLAFEKSVSLAEQVDKSIELMGLAEELERLVKILLDNACKYVNVGGSIQLELHKLSDSCLLSVTNSGEPIPAEDLHNIFQRFYRSDSSRQRKSGGFGLGLAIAHAIVSKHKGVIRVSSSLEEGTCFSVELPLPQYPEL